MTTLPLAHIGKGPPGHAHVGYDQEGQPLIVDTNHEPHMLISGASGSGKGGFARILQCNDMAQGHIIIVCQPKPGENGWMDGAATIATTPQDITTALAYVVNEQDQRQAALEHHLGPNGIRGLDSYLDLPDPPPRIVVYIDEITAIAGPAAALNYTRDEIQANTNYLAEIAQRGRSAGVALRIMTQRPTLLGTFGSNTVGGGIFSSLAQRFHFDREAESLKAAFNHCERISNRVLTLIASGTAGRCAYAYARPEDYGRVKAGQIAWVSPEQARQFALDYEGPPPPRLTQTFTPQGQQ